LGERGNEALLAAAPAVGRGPGLTLPGFAINGGNNPPVFLAQSLTLTGPQELTLRALAFDPDGDGLTITYEQVSGPQAIEDARTRIGGSLNVRLFIPGDGPYVFRVVAGDGFFNSDVVVTIEVNTQPPAFDPIPTIGAGSVTNPFVGTFAVNVTGQVLDATGNTSFSQPTTLRIEPRPAVYFGTNQVVVTLATTTLPTANLSSLGAMFLTTQATRAGQLYDSVAVTIHGSQLVMVGGTPGVPLAAGQAAIFRPGPIANGVVPAATVEAALTLSGNAISGTLRMTDTTGLITYFAQLAGTRSP
jgi:hypothetical protein